MNLATLELPEEVFYGLFAFYGVSGAFLILASALAKNDTVGWRIGRAVIGLALLGYCAYGFLGDPAEVWISPKLVIAPILLVGQAIMVLFKKPEPAPDLSQLPPPSAPPAYPAPGMLPPPQGAPAPGQAPAQFATPGQAPAPGQFAAPGQAPAPQQQPGFVPSQAGYVPPTPAAPQAQVPPQ
ncbi:hypothetical protein R8Z50_34715 [Longispora sp. K20-0274]|uniref:hypothetical protein n=1 Tax=Longispora sp. K20-0274 TaxID=3088255 RepID=UPI00399B74B2